jgi:hypothetical protein
MISNDDLLRMVKQECFSHGVSVITLHAYRNFALQVEKTRKGLGGNELAVVVAALVERYVKLGLDRRVLEDIAYNVFNVRPPKPVV